jgi:hypothetical protein
MTVVMPPPRASTLPFHNKPYYPDLTVRRSSRLALDHPRRKQNSSQPPPTKRRRIPIDPPPTPKALTRSKDIKPTPIPSSSKRKADTSLIEDDGHSGASSSILSRRKKRRENAVLEKAPSPPHNQVCVCVVLPRESVY